MSTVSLSYADVVRVRRAPAIGKVLLLSSLALIVVIVLALISAANADLNNRATASQNFSAPVAVPIATPSAANIQPVPSETPSPASGLTSRPSVVPVPVPTPPPL